MRTRKSEDPYDSETAENAEAAGISVGLKGKEPSISGVPLASFMSEDLMMWYLSEVKSGRASDWYIFLMSLGMKRFSPPSDSQLQRKYARLKKAGVSKEAICAAATSSAGHKVFNAILIIFGIIFATIIVSPIIGGIAGNIILALSGGSGLAGAPALAAIALTCIPGPIIGAVLGYMFVKGSNDKRARRIREKIDELDKMA